jgi:hypothetical protein
MGTRAWGCLGALLAAAALSGCETAAGNIALGAIGATVVNSRSAGAELEQIYYFGVFDPQDQLPPTVYRVRVHGQASTFSFTKFASGWVRADVIDSLGTSVAFERNGAAPIITKAADDELATIQTGRRLVLFGPEGFREAPKGHRLVIMMGTNPEKFFEAIDSSLGAVAEAQAGQRTQALDRTLFQELVRMRAERDGLEVVRRDVEADVPAPKTVAQ